MNRRSFFGFACGGVVAAPAALMGERASAIVFTGGAPAGLQMMSKPPEVVHVALTADTKRIGQMIQAGIDEAMARYDARKGSAYAKRG